MFEDAEKDCNSEWSKRTVDLEVEKMLFFLVNELFSQAIQSDFPHPNNVFCNALSTMLYSESSVPSVKF